jgi:hypothetical protein
MFHKKELIPARKYCELLAVLRQKQQQRQQERSTTTTEDTTTTTVATARGADLSQSFSNSMCSRAAIVTPSKTPNKRILDEFGSTAKDNRKPPAKTTSKLKNKTEAEDAEMGEKNPVIRIVDDDDDDEGSSERKPTPVTNAKTDTATIAAVASLPRSPIVAPLNKRTREEQPCENGPGKRKVRQRIQESSERAIPSARNAGADTENESPQPSAEVEQPRQLDRAWRANDHTAREVTLSESQIKYLKIVKKKSDEKEKSSGTKTAPWALLKVFYSADHEKCWTKEELMKEAEQYFGAKLEKEHHLLDSPTFGAWSSNKTLKKHELIERRNGGSKGDRFWLTEQGCLFCDKLFATPEVITSSFQKKKSTSSPITNFFQMRR